LRPWRGVFGFLPEQARKCQLRSGFRACEKRLRFQHAQFWQVQVEIDQRRQAEVQQQEKEFQFGSISVAISFRYTRHVAV
jgi:hypothetical protein